LAELALGFQTVGPQQTQNIIQGLALGSADWRR
jgi:hypothetical protein